MSKPDRSENTALQVTCLCAQWCGTCKDYAGLFASLAQAFPTVAFRWVDIEDEADLVDPVEVDNFPTLLIARQGRAQFFGSITPHLETLRRLIQAHLENDSASLHPEPEVQALASRLN